MSRRSSWSGLNQVDATYRADLRELNELNFARFDAKLEQHLAELRAELKADVAVLRAEVVALDDRFQHRLNSSVAALKTELIRWMFLFWAGTVLPVIGVVIALLR